LLESHATSPYSLAGFRGPTSKESEIRGKKRGIGKWKKKGKGREVKGKEGGKGMGGKGKDGRHPPDLELATGLCNIFQHSE